MISDNPKIDTLKIASGGQLHGIYFVKNEGDLNDDGSDEISYVVHWADFSGLNTWHIVSFQNNKWNELYSFPIIEYQIDNFENGKSSLVKKIRKNKIQVEYLTEDADTKTKIVELK